MPKGRHKGAHRQFTNFDVEEEQREKEQKAAQWRARRGEAPSGSESGSEESGSEGEEESGSGEEKEAKPKGVSGLIQTENPNRQAQQKNQKVSQLDEATGEPKQPQLSRREREQLEKQRSTAHYRKLHAEGKTEEARADLERLAIIRKQREEAANRKKEEKEAKEAAAAAKKEEAAKFMSKKGKR